MPDTEASNVTMRVRVGEYEIEVTGPSDFVERKVAEFIKQQRSLPPVPPSVDEKPRLSDSEPPIRGSRSEAQFFRQLAPQTDVDRALGAGYYLEKIKGYDSFTAAEVRDTIRAAKTQPPKNPSDVIAKNIKKGLIMSAGDKDGKMAYVLTTDGEEYVDATIGQ